MQNLIPFLGFLILSPMIFQGCAYTLSEQDPLDKEGRSIERAAEFDILLYKEFRGHMTVSCSIDGIIGSCMFDSGWSLSPGVFSCAAGVSGDWGLPTSNISASGTNKKYENRKISHFEIGNMHFNDIFVTLKPDERCFLFQGIIGNSLFPKSLLIDFKHKILTQNLGHFPVPEILYKVRSETLSFIKIKVGEESVLALFDTGSPVSILNQNLFDKIAKDSGRKVRKSKYFGIDSNKTKIAFDREMTSDLAIASMVVKDAQIMAVDLEPLRTGIRVPFDMILGVDIIRQFNWAFDFENERWGIKPLDAM